ncbi:nitrite/sulfite reductase [Romboutsia maritimum]|uniref:Nitrite/sulfite reductase n=1 Tax=Romboutsia maritimum TaxID=2020948 RepID=A0A371IVQ9_9FIRM|nr:nitrite/sulfite reductase [Romboutsia maritimum]RDY24565.1 nitrite/sulfite reductase [Romboutsia maritimum]
MDNVKKIFLDEIPNFKEYSLKFINNEVSKMEYKGFSGGYGVYAQRDKNLFVIRLRFSCGVLSRAQLHIIHQMASKHKLNKIHLTTRQAIQLHNLNVDDLCNIMEEGIHKDIFTRGSGGNFPRNVGLSPLSGVDPYEAFDVAPYAIATDKYFISKIPTYHLPRKLKVSYSSSNKDTAHCTIQDLGFVATIRNNEPYFRVFLGGGLGKNPAVSLELDELIKPCDVLYYVEGMTKLFITEGNYENKNKARIRYIVEKLGKDMFLKKFKEFVQIEKEKGGLDLHPEAIDYSKPGIKINISDPRLIKQKQEGLYSVYIHPIGGQLLIKDLKILLYELDKVKNPMIRLAMTEGLYILNLDGNEAKKILEVSNSISGNTSLEKSISCIGIPICQIGIQNSQEMLHEIIDYFRENCNGDYTILNAMPRIYISGCSNSCGVHQIGAIGLSGKIKNIDGKSTDAFELHVGGSFNLNDTKLGYSLGDFKSSDLPKMLFEIAEHVANSNKPFYNWLNEHANELSQITSKYKI